MFKIYFIVLGVFLNCSWLEMDDVDVNAKADEGKYEHTTMHSVRKVC